MEYHGLVVNKQDTFLTVLESEESKSNVPVDSRSGESSLLISWWLSFIGNFTWQKGPGKSLGSLS